MFTHKNVSAQPLSIASFVVSICALFLTIYQARTTETNNRIAVLPHIQFERIDDPSGKSIEIYVINNGLGPARVTGIEAHVGEEFVRFQDHLNWSKLNSMLEPLGISIQTAYASTIPVGSFVRANERHLLLRVPITPPHDIKYLNARLEKLNLALCYCSMYGDCYHIAEVSGISDEGTCRYDGTFQIFGSRIRFKSPFSTAPDSNTTHGY